MGTIVECLHDEKGLVWPDSVAPFDVHLISLARVAAEEEVVTNVADQLNRVGLQVLYDDRAEIQAGQKFAESDLIGIPNRVVVSQRTIASGGIELKRRSGQKTETLSIEQLLSALCSSRVGRP